MRIVHGGFSYHNSVVRTNPPVRYLICSKYSKAGCHGRAVLPLNGVIQELKITQPHNHPPDNAVEEKAAFYKELKALVENASMNMSMRKIFDAAIELHPNVCSIISYESVRTTMRRWKIRVSGKL